MAAQDGADGAEAVVHEAVGVEEIVLVIVISSAVILVATALGDDVNRTAAGAAELGREAVGLDAEFLHCVWRGAEGDTVEVANRVDCTVEEDFVGRGSAATDREVGIEDSPAPAGVAYLAFGNDAGGQTHNRHDVALDQRKFVDGLRTDGGADITCFRLEDRGFFGDLDLCGHTQEGHFEIENSGLIDFEAYLLLDLLLEACGCDRDFVEAGWENRDRVNSGGIGGGRLSGIGLNLSCDNDCSSNWGTGRIVHGAGKAGSESLGGK